jgi:beta-glucosidase
VLDPRDFAFYDPATKDWRLESGEFEIIVATSSETIHGTKLIDIK